MTSLDAPPQVVGTISATALAALAAAPRADDRPDIVEARFDLALSDPAAGSAAASWHADLRPYFASCAQLESSGSPVLATIRLIADGGRWTEDAGRLPWFEQALAVTAAVDIEIESAIASEVIRAAHARHRRVIVSHHDFTGTPAVETMRGWLRRGRDLGADIVKIATRVDDLEAHDRLIAFLTEQRATGGAPLALIGMGAMGTPLRTYLPCIGSRLTYGYLDAVAAPGQIHASELVRRLVTDCPAYAAARREK